jgi:DNA-binding transcriptional MocR family regulator
MWLPHLDPERGPLYLAIADALAQDVASGRLEPGARLPTHRELADGLGVTVGTVTRGYAEAARRGLLSGEVGRGSFVRGVVSELPPARGGARGLIDLSRNHPPPLDLGRGAGLARTLSSLARDSDLTALLEYAPDGGAPAHRAAGASWMALTGLKLTPDQVLVTSGSQHALTAVMSALARPGDLVLTESLTYPGVKARAGGLLHLRLQALPMDAQGMRPDAFEEACRSATVRALYCIPTIHNPTGVVMPEARRRELARIARAHDVLIVEDDVHGLLAEDAPPPIAAFAPELGCYLLSTAKTLAPGLRTGFVAAHPTLLPRIAAAIRATTWMAAPLMAEIVARWIGDGTARQVVRLRRDEARARQRLAAAALRGFRVDAHPSAHHLWLHLPEPWRSESFAEEARRHGVAVTPSQSFLVGRAAAPHAVRVCLGAPADRGQLEQGLRTLASLLHAPAEASAMLV